MIASPRVYRITLFVLIFGIALCIVGLAFAIRHGQQTDKRVREIAQRVLVISQPSEARRKAGVARAVRELSPEDAQKLLNHLLEASTPAQRKRLRDIVRENRREVERRRRERRRRDANGGSGGAPPPSGSSQTTPNAPARPPSAPSNGQSGSNPPSGTPSAQAPSQNPAPPPRSQPPPRPQPQPGNPSATTPRAPQATVSTPVTPPLTTPQVPQVTTPQLPLPQPCNVPVVGRPC